jgi:asparagine synthase (glutamine-hydrolysing)
MCGIAGILSLGDKPVGVEEIRAMCSALVHRGPDDEGCFHARGIGLGMRRLSVIDLRTGRQPVTNEDGSVAAVFNGEIYNFASLRADLERRGHRFRTAGDGEVIVHLYEERGERCVEALRGMFAFAVWDEPRRRLLLARDRLGIKPLYYAEAGGRLLFASELKALLQVPGLPVDLDWRALGHLFTSLSTPIDQSILAGVRKLEPGRILMASPRRPPRTEVYWGIEFAPDRLTREDELAGRLGDLIRESVGLHLASDVPLGAFLSGGLDSSSVVAAMARLSPGPVKTFSIGFAEAEYDELRHARSVAERFATDHHELVLRPDALGILEDLAWHLDEPLGDPSAIPTYMISRLAAEHVTVVLSGDGGDELFAGYDKYGVEGRERRGESLTAPARAVMGALARMVPEGRPGHNFLRHRSLAGAERYLDASTLFTRAKQRRLFHPEVFERVARHDPWLEAKRLLSRSRGHWLSSLQHLDLTSYLPLDVLTKVDRMSMAHSLEVRVPLLDHKVVEFAATVPPELQVGRGPKSLLKRAMRGILPDAILDRPKQGFAVPLGAWFRGGTGGFVRDLLFSTRCRQRGIFDETYVERLLKWHDAGRPLDFELWTLISFELWCRQVLEAPRPRPARRSVTPTLAGEAGGAPGERPCTRMRPKIALVAASLEILGGQAVQARALAARLREDGCEVALVPINPPFPPGFRWVRRWPYARTLLNEALFLPGLLRLQRADVVHLFSASYWSFLLAPAPVLLAARALGKRVVLHYHSGEAGEHLDRWGVLVHPWLRLADEIVVPSEYLRAIFARHGHRARVIPNVVDLSSFEYRERRPLRPRLLSTRNLEPHYRVDTTLQAFALLRARHPGATLTIAGTGGEEARLRGLARALGAEGVRFVGRAEPDAIPALCDGADIFVNSSVVDNQPVSILEAFAAGLAVVSTPTGDIPAMVSDGETGLLVPPGDAPAMAEAIGRLLDQPDQAVRMASRARQALARYTWAHVGPRWHAAYSGRAA